MSPDAVPPVLAVDGLEVEFATRAGTVRAVRGASYAVASGRTLAVVGESGCGKSVTLQAVMGLVDSPPGRIAAGSARLLGRELVGLPARELDRLRGATVGMIFQDPMSALNPLMRVGEQIAEPLVAHRGMSRRAALARAVELLERTRIPAARERARQYPFEFSGGMLQRVMIAIALACRPALLIADEPTTALDVTVQDQVLGLMQEIQRADGMAIVLVTHDLGVVARMADDVAVMYAGRVVEHGAVDDIFYRHAHPYSAGLLQALPGAARDRGQPLQPIPGSPPDLRTPPPGCAYAARCPRAMRICTRLEPPEFALAAGHGARCWLHHPAAAGGATTAPGAAR
jgi:oligopeptide/dipeptide ABC transporter ATP-binding protein